MFHEGATKALDGTLDDYAFVALALLELAEVTGDRAWWDLGAKLVGTLRTRFVAEEDGVVVFYLSPAGDPLLVHRPESHHDGAIPSGAAIAVHALLRLGPRLYLEVIAVDPEGAPPSRPRWFDLDEPRMRARLADEPALIHWVARTRDIEHDATCGREDLGAVETMQRGDFRWRMTIPSDGHLPARGLVPTLIEWSGTRHPCDALPGAGRLFD